MDKLARYQLASMKISSSRCPANMLANSRTPRVNGWTTKNLSSSIGIRMTRMGLGTSQGIMFLM